MRKQQVLDAARAARGVRGGAMKVPVSDGILAEAPGARREIEVPE